MVGLQAITGKGDFDLGEVILHRLLKEFGEQRGRLALLLKNSVIRQLIRDQKFYHFPIGKLEKLGIDAKAEFGAVTQGALLIGQLDSSPAYELSEYDFYQKTFLQTIGWVGEKFVSNTKVYENHAAIDGKSVFKWRSGIKHDCSKVMEFTRQGDLFQNKLGKKFTLESDWVYGLIKSADLQKEAVLPRKFTIITQKKIGDDTAIIKKSAPKTWSYLTAHAKLLNNRKSAIYKNNPPYSIFGVGEYAFKPYKVAVSSMYKKLRFRMVKPIEGKPLMLDDTCYFIGFDNRDFAQVTVELLNHPVTMKFLHSIIFLDHQRIVTQEILQRLDLPIILDIVLKDSEHPPSEELASRSADFWRDYFEA